MFQERNEIQCNDCLDFMARAALHAVILSLDTEHGTELPPLDLKTFQIFEERICDLMRYNPSPLFNEPHLLTNGDQRWKAAKAFKDLGRLEHDLALGQHGKASQKIIVKVLDSSNDPFHLLEVHDVGDELRNLMKPFNQQITVLKR
jgi:hypothetical protein